MIRFFKNTIFKLAIAISFLILAALFSDSYAKADSDIAVNCQKYETNIGHLKRQSLVKTESQEFWNIIEERVVNYPEALRLKGVVIGDLHFANLGIYFDPRSGHKVLTFNDLDDSSDSAFIIGDILKFILYLKAFKKIDFKIGDIIQAYHKGISGEPILNYPNGIVEKLTLSSGKANNENAKYIDKKVKTEGDKFNMAAAANGDQSLLTEIENSYLEKMLVTSKWINVEDSGSSKGMKRYLYSGYLPEDPLKKTILVEFKKLKCSSSTSAAEQDIKSSFEKVKDYLANASLPYNNKGEFLKKQEVILLAGEYYLRRLKYPNLLNDLGLDQELKRIDKQKKGKQKKADSDSREASDQSHLTLNEMQEYAQFYAHYLGLLHRPEVSNGFVKAVEEHKSFLVQEAKIIKDQFFKDY